jgi:excisionase family DNA binding protein
MSNYLSPTQVADRLGVPVATIHQWRWKGTGPAWIRIGRHLRISEAALERWVAEREREAASRAR